MIEVGSTVYYFDENHRIYDDRNRISYRDHFRPVTITGETSRSWVIGSFRPALKVNKKTVAETGRDGRVYVSIDEVEHQIAAIVGYSETD